MRNMKGDRLKIATIHGADMGGGAERSVLSHHKALLRMGHESRLYVGYKLTDSEGVEEIRRIRGIPGMQRLAAALQQRFGWQNLYVPGFRALVDIIDPDTDILHIHTLWGSGGYADLGGLPALSRRFPTIITLRESWLLTGHCACPFECRRWMNGCGKCPDLKRAPAVTVDGTAFNWRRKLHVMRKTRAHFTTVSDWLRREAEKSPILAGKEITAIHNGINTDVFNPGNGGVGIRAKLGIADDRIVVLMAGQSIEGINEGIAQQGVEALNQINDERLLVLLIGRSAGKVAETLKVPHIILPFQKEPADMADCFRAADMTLVTSEYESFGRIAAESQACGTPVISFATGGLSEVVRSEVGGLLVSTGDTSGLGDAVARLIGDTELRTAMGERAAGWATEQFADERISNAFVALYRKLSVEFGRRR